jgi:hypothetical protein
VVQADGLPDLPCGVRQNWIETAATIARVEFAAQEKKRSNGDRAIADPVGSSLPAADADFRFDFGNIRLQRNRC